MRVVKERSFVFIFQGWGLAIPGGTETRETQAETGLDKTACLERHGYELHEELSFWMEFL